MLRNYDCPLCLEFRAAATQLSIGFVYPYLLAPMASLMFATRHFTVRLPYITEQPKEWLRLWIKMTRTSKSLALYLFLANLISATAVTTLEFKEMAFINEEMEEHARKVEQGLIEED
jgi:transmembrane protein 126A